MGFVKLAAGCLLSIYYPLQIALALYYVSYLGKGRPPFSDCASVKMTQNGYLPQGISGQLCLKKTFLESPFTEPIWFGIYASLLFAVWVATIGFLYKRTRTYTKSLILLLFLIVAALIYMIIVAYERNKGLSYLLENIEWKRLLTAEIWYFAAVQVFFSTNVGFGVFITNASTLFKKTNPFWISFTFIITNLILGLGSTLLFYTFSAKVPLTPEDDEIREVQLLAHVYDIGLNMADGYSQPLTLVIFFFFAFSGLISMITIVYTILKTIYFAVRRKMAWWQLLFVFSFIVFVIGAALLLYEDLKLLHALDYYIVGNLILISVILEIFGFVMFYGKLVVFICNTNIT